MLLFFSLKKNPIKVSVERLTAAQREAMINNLTGIEPALAPLLPHLYSSSALGCRMHEYKANECVSTETNVYTTPLLSLKNNCSLIWEV